MACCLHTWMKEYTRGVWLGFFRCKRCRRRGVCPGCYGFAPSGITVRYCDRHA